MKPVQITNLIVPSIECNGPAILVRVGYPVAAGKLSGCCLRIFFSSPNRMPDEPNQLIARISEVPIRLNNPPDLTFNIGISIESAGQVLGSSWRRVYSVEAIALPDRRIWSAPISKRDYLVMAGWFRRSTLLARTGCTRNRTAPPNTIESIALINFNGLPQMKPRNICTAAWSNQWDATLCAFLTIKHFLKYVVYIETCVAVNWFELTWHGKASCI